MMERESLVARLWTRRCNGCADTSSHDAHLTLFGLLYFRLRRWRPAADGGCLKLHWAIRLRKRLLICRNSAWNAWVRDFTARLERNERAGAPFQAPADDRCVGCSEDGEAD